MDLRANLLLAAAATSATVNTHSTPVRQPPDHTAVNGVVRNWRETKWDQAGQGRLIV
jgi:hypothetical protein